MSKKLLLLIMMSFSVAVGGFWALQAQDPAPQSPKTDPPTVSAETTQTDLSGTYTGTFNCDALGLTGPTTLTITGTDFTTADGKSGRIVASTTGGYTAVALQMGGTGTAATTTATTPTTATPMIVSMRARKSGTRLTLTPAPGSTVKCSFVPGRGVARGRRTPAPTGTEVANPATTPTPTETPTPSQTPSPSPSPSPTESPTPMPSPTPGEPTPSPSPTPSASPTPSPSPGEPMPSPSPGEPTPSPSPTPTPSPSPRY